MDLLVAVGEEHLSRAGHLHQLRALARHGLLDHAADPAGPGVLELHVALVGDHRPELRLDRDVGELDLQQLGVLLGERLVALRLLKFR